jgi:RNA polymerase sigma-B factor
MFDYDGRWTELPVEPPGRPELPAGNAARPDPTQATEVPDVAAKIAMGAHGQLSDAELLSVHHRSRDQHLRAELVERFLPLARSLALRYRYTHEPLDDLVQVASLGLLKAIDRFEPGLGNRFTSFAAPTILGELKRHFRDKGWAMHVPRELQERALALGRETERLSQNLRRPPTIPELATGLGWSIESVLEAHEVARNYEPASLDAPVANRDEDVSALIDILGRTDEGFQLAESRDAVARTWSELSELEREVLTLRCLHDMTQREIGDKIGYSQMQVSRMLRRSVERLVAAAGD